MRESSKAIIGDNNTLIVQFGAPVDSKQSTKFSLYIRVRREVPFVFR